MCVPPSAAIVDVYANNLLEYLPVKHRVMLLSTCKSLAEHKQEAVKCIIPEIRSIKMAMGKMVDCEYTVIKHQDMVYFEYECSYHDDGVCFWFKAFYEKKTAPRFVERIWNKLPAVKGQINGIETDSNDGKILANISIDITHRNWPENRVVMKTLFVPLLPKNELVAERWRSVFSNSEVLYGNRQRIHWKMISRFDDKHDDPDVKEFYGSFPIESTAEFYHGIDELEEVDEIYGVDYEYIVNVESFDSVTVYNRNEENVEWTDSLCFRCRMRADNLINDGAVNQ